MRATALLVSLAVVSLLPTAYAAANEPSAHALQTLNHQTRQLDRVHNVIVAYDGEIIHEFHQGGPGVASPTNIKSLSKTVLAAITGAAIEEGIIESVEQPMAALFGEHLPAGLDPRVENITVAHLLAQQAGLERTSGSNYGAWVASANWVNDALSRPFVDEPGGRMLYSTGTSHLLSAALTHASGETTYALAQRLLGEPLNISIPPWLRDPQGIYFGGNDMQLSPRALIEVGELYRNDGMMEGQRILPEGWVEDSWTPRGISQWTGDGYGFGWFITQLAETPTYYGRGYGGQALYVIPERAMTVVITSDPTPPSPGGQFQQRLNQLVEGLLDAY
ncbi:serine hydrolase domain-containing protein [Vreelandella populi]|uniref:Class C beta-lactamase-related serine hydrolase n=1 Tax=Vreelandella populi TaxID=2498858 RepID=A0A433LE33_9GAMM|nr:serine hydrolase [Halomonas populi]RUR35240.1 class C beta-lactamase-related serine hydrolase [Halomonas populi]RUR47431.1 class C beta-lactamase-related serine hydrolase [Halomonas populi]